MGTADSAASVTVDGRFRACEGFTATVVDAILPVSTAETTGYQYADVVSVLNWPVARERELRMSEASSGAMTAEQYTKAALDHVWIHSANWGEIAADKGLKIFERGEGALLFDVDGREYIDGIAGLWVVNAGHGRAEIGEGPPAEPGRRRSRTARGCRPTGPSSAG